MFKTKKGKIERVIELLKKLGYGNGNCCNIDKVPNVHWVSLSRVCMKEKSGDRNFTPRLNSSYVTNEILNSIGDELEKRVLKRVPYRCAVEGFKK